MSRAINLYVDRPIRIYKKGKFIRVMTGKELEDAITEWEKKNVDKE